MAIFWQIFIVEARCQQWQLTAPTLSSFWLVRQDLMSYIGCSEWLRASIEYVVSLPTNYRLCTTVTCQRGCKDADSK
jgi:hypothetical protein